MANTRTYLQLTNFVLNELNEVELTSSNFSSSRGVQTSAKNFINKAINDLYMAEVEWPWLHTDGTQVAITGQQEYDFPAAFRKANFDSFRIAPTNLITNGEFTSDITSWTTIAGSGSAAYNSAGNGRLRLNDFAAHQSISTIVGETYNISVRAFDSNSTGQAFKVQVGTAAEGTQNLNSTITVTDFGNGEILSTTFTATAATTFVTLNNTTTATNMDVDYVRVKRQEEAVKLKPMTYDGFLQGAFRKDVAANDSQYGKPLFVYRTPDHKSFGLSPIPKFDDYTVFYEYYKTHTELSAHGDTMDLPDIYADVIVNRAKYYLYKLKNDVPMANISNAEYEAGVKRIRIEMLNHIEYMKDTRVNLNTSNRTTSNTSVLTVT